MHQFTLLSAPPPLPEGMSFDPTFLSPTDERDLLSHLQSLPFREARFREWTARRRIVSYGVRYDFTHHTLEPSDPIPPFLLPLRNRVATWIGVDPAALRHALINEYRPDTPLGWHRDAPAYETVVGISLAGTARMRLRAWPPEQHSDTPLSLDLPPRSAYVLSGASRWAWQHAISPTKCLRYSITFRTLVESAATP
jgi:alkylated DNA repair dioxygenase AlkB